MSDLPTDFELKLMPDWLKETPAARNPYADYQVREGERPESRGPRDREPLRDAGGRGPKRPAQRDRPGGGRGDRRGEPPAGRREARPPEAAPLAAAPANVSVDFLPDPNFVASLVKQIKASSRAWPLFGLARLFLEKPERHRVRITSHDPAAPLWRIGEDGPVTLDRPFAERLAFQALKDTYFTIETTQQDPPKGNFSNVARCRLTGTFLGPTNHHGYQPALRKLYEERFSRRMSLQDYSKNIEILTDPAAVEAWKENARSVTVFKTIGEGDPLTFPSAVEAEQHFRKHCLEAALRSGATFELTGEKSRQLEDRRLMQSIKQTWEKERSFPGGMMHHIRRGFAGLHFFKYRKRMQFITAIWPTPLKREGLSENIAAILRILEESPGCTRADLAARVLRENPTEEAKATLLRDLHWLTHSGHVIEFHDGRLDLPLTKPESSAAEEPPQRAAAADISPVSPGVSPVRSPQEQAQ